MRKLGFILLFAVGELAAFGDAPVSNVSAVFRSGQTFVTWDNLPGTGCVFTVDLPRVRALELAAV